MFLGSLRPANRLRILYIIGLSAVAIFLVVAELIIQKRITQQETDSRVVNIAGRQRMLSQKLTKAALGIQATENDSDDEHYIAEIREILVLWSHSHAILQNGDPKTGIPATTEQSIVKKYSAIEPHYQSMYQAGNRILETISKTAPLKVDRVAMKHATDEILSHEAAFLKGMNEIVYAYDREAKAKVVHLKNTETVLIVLVLFLLLLVGLVIFEPAVRLIRKQFDQLSTVAEERQQLIDELQEALVTVKKLRGLLPICASCKKIRNDGGYWTQIEKYIEDHSDAVFTHGICPECTEELYPDFSKRAST